MYQSQPDERIRRNDLGVLSLNGKRFVTHNVAGCPHNAVIESFAGHLRCWSCKKALTDDAADYLRENSRFRSGKEENYEALVWKEGFYHVIPNKRSMREGA